MREAVLIAGGLLLGSIALFALAGMGWLPTAGHFNLIALLLAFVMMLLAPVVLALTWFFSVSVIPDEKKRDEDDCD
jgi:hypothetical protein